MENNWKKEMYSKLTKEELINLLIEKDEQLCNKQMSVPYPVPVYQEPNIWKFNQPVWPTVTTPPLTVEVTCPENAMWLVDFDKLPKYSTGQVI